MGKTSDFYYEITALHKEVTGSCLMVLIYYPDGRKTMFLVDCGLFQEKDYLWRNAEKFPFNCENVEFVLITHNHADHMGRLPMLVNAGFKGKIYATETTKILMLPALQDSHQIMKEEAKKKKEKPQYEDTDVQRAFSSTQGCKLEETVYLDRNIKATFFDNGHLIGSAMILVQISYPGYKDLNLFFTGDYKPHNIFREVKPLPLWARQIPKTFVVESTYGYMETSQIHYHFEDDVAKLTSEGKNLLIFIFAQQRAQEILFFLKNMQESGRLDKKIPIYLDGKLSHVYTKIYSSCEVGIDEDKRDFLPANLVLVTKENRNEVLYSKEQKIILTTSGMADHGPAQIYVPAFVERSDYAFYFTGYTSKTTLGYKLQHPAEDGTVKIQGKDMHVNAQVLWTNEASSHAKADELENLIASCSKNQLLLINHGQEEVQQQFACRIEDKKLAKRVEIIGEHIARVNCYGCVKIMGSKCYADRPKLSAKVNKKETHKTSKKRMFIRKPRRIVFQH